MWQSKMSVHIVKCPLWRKLSLTENFCNRQIQQLRQFLEHSLYCSTILFTIPYMFLIPVEPISMVCASTFNLFLWPNSFSMNKVVVGLVMMENIKMKVKGSRETEWGQVDYHGVGLLEHHRKRNPDASKGFIPTGSVPTSQVRKWHSGPIS